MLLNLRAVDAARAVFGGDAVAYSPRLYILLIAQKELAHGPGSDPQKWPVAAPGSGYFFWVLTDRSKCGK